MILSTVPIVCVYLPYVRCNFCDRRYWEVVELTRKLILSGLIGVVGRGTVAQAVAGTLIAFYFFAISYREQLGVGGWGAGTCAADLACAFAVGYRQLVGAIHAVHANTTVLLMVPPQTYGRLHKTDVLRALVPAVSAELGLAPPIDLYSALQGTPEPPPCAARGGSGGCRYFCDAQFCDQLHPNEAGYCVIARAVAAALGAPTPAPTPTPCHLGDCGTPIPAPAFTPTPTPCTPETVAEMVWMSSE